MKEINITPALYLLPSGMSEAAPDAVIPSYNIQIMKGIRHFVVENVRTARRWIRKCDHDFCFDNVEFVELNTHTRSEDVGAMLDPLRKEGLPIGVISEAGCPAIADPGSDIVALAQSYGLKVVPLVGPSSILLSLMGSGFNGQSFSFHGYLPIEDKDKIAYLGKLERESAKENRTQIFIETPYRNNKLLTLMAEKLMSDTLICVACNITDPSEESIITKSASDWRKTRFDYSKKPAIFLIYRREAGASGLIYSTKGGKRR